MGRARISTPPPPAVAEGEGGRCAGSSPAPARRGVRDATDAPDHHHQHRTTRGNGTPWTCRITPAPARRGVGRDALDAPGSHQRPQPWRKWTPWTRPDHTSTRSRGGRKNRRVYARLFYFLSQKSMYNILPSNAFKISTSNDNIFLSFLQSPPNWGNVSNLVKQYFVIHGNLSL